MTDHSNSKPQSYADLYPSKYLKAKHLNGKSYVLTIESTSVEKVRQFDGSYAWKVILHLYETNKLFILNKTQCKAMVELTGSEQFDKWVGHRINLSPKQAPNGKPTIGISKASTLPAQPKSPRQAETHTPKVDLIPVPVHQNGQLHGQENGYVD